MCTFKNLFRRFLSRVVQTREFARDVRGSISVELVIVLPLLLWALAATVVFFDGFRSRYTTQSAAQTVADAMSRLTDSFTPEYMEGMNNVFDFLAGTSADTRLRISSVQWDADAGEFDLVWSYGTRGLPALPDNVFELLSAGDMTTLEAVFGDGSGLGFDNSGVQVPSEDLASRIPPILPGEAILVVESFAIWTPFANIGLGQLRLNSIVPIRSRFASQQSLEGEEPGYTNEPDDDVPNNAAFDPPPPPSDLGFEDQTQYKTVIHNQRFEDLIWLGGSWGTLSRTLFGPTGSYLGRFGSSTWDSPIDMNVDVGSNSDVVYIDFDLFIFDNWDGYSTSNSLPRGDTMLFTINDIPIAIEPFDNSVSGIYANNRVSSVYLGNSLITTELSLRRSGSNFGSGFAHDQIWRVSITGWNMPSNFRFGLRAGTNGWTSDESWGFDNFMVTGGRGASWSPVINVDTSAAHAWSPYTQMPFFAGCPDVRMPAQWLTMRLSQVNASFSISRTAGGPTPLNECSSLPGTGYTMASPSLVLNYDNEGLSGPGNGLKIVADDGYGGSTCDATLLVRDPNGQWFFNDDSQAQVPEIYLSSAPTGQYYIYVGAATSGYCYPRLRFERY